MIRNTCDLANLCLAVGTLTLDGPTVLSFLASLSAFVWFSLQIHDRWKAKRDAKRVVLAVRIVEDDGDSEG